MVLFSRTWFYVADTQKEMNEWVRVLGSPVE